MTAVRAAGNFKLVAPAIRDKVMALAADPSRDVQLQVAIAARRMENVQPLVALLDVLRHAGDDKLIPHIVWQNLQAMLEIDSDKLLADVTSKGLHKNIAALMPRIAERIFRCSDRNDLTAQAENRSTFDDGKFLQCRSAAWAGPRRNILQCEKLADVDQQQSGLSGGCSFGGGHAYLSLAALLVAATMRRYRLSRFVPLCGIPESA